MQTVEADRDSSMRFLERWEYGRNMTEKQIVTPSTCLDRLQPPVYKMDV